MTAFADAAKFGRLLMSSRELEQWLDPAGPGNPHQLPVGEETSLPRARGLPTALNTSLSQQSASCKSAGRQSTCLPPRDFRPEPDSYREAGAQQTPPSSPERGRGGREDEGVPGALNAASLLQDVSGPWLCEQAPWLTGPRFPSTVTSFPICILPTLSGLTYTVLNLRCSPLAGTTIKPHLPSQCTHHFPPWPKPPPPGPLQSLPPGLLLLPHKYPPQVARGSI